MVIDLTKICKKYKGFWVALKDDKKTVIVAARTAKVALKKARRKGFDEPILFRVPTKINLIL